MAKKRKRLNRYNARIYRQGLKERKRIAAGYYSRVSGATLAPDLTQEDIKTLYGKRPQNALKANALIKGLMVDKTQITGKWAYASGIRPTKDSEDPFNRLFVQAGKYDEGRGYKNFAEFKKAFLEAYDELQYKYSGIELELVQSAWKSFFYGVKNEFTEQLDLKGDLVRSLNIQF